MKLEDDRLLKCPGCGDANGTHHDRVTIYSRYDDEKDVTPYVIKSLGFEEDTDPPEKIPPNPSSRRSGLIIEGWCELCPCRWNLTIGQHKGVTIIECLEIDSENSKQVHKKEPKLNDKYILYGEQNAACAACSIKGELRHFEIDHIEPQVQGGNHELDNLQLLCSSCNRIKGDRPMHYLLDRLNNGVKEQ